MLSLFWGAFEPRGVRKPIPHRFQGCEKGAPSSLVCLASRVSSELEGYVENWSGGSHISLSVKSNTASLEIR